MAELVTKTAEHEYEEDIEGLDLDPEFEADYPIDSFLIRTEQRTVFEIIRRMNQTDSIYIQPDFQRDFIWSEEKQSRLIESVLLRIPLPVFYLAEREDGRIIIVDGLQRLTTFRRYLNNQFALQGVNNKNLEGKTFEELPMRLKARVEDTSLTLYLIDPQVPERARLDIFERVNSGEPLSRQQMRNALYNGPATRWLRKSASSEEFLQTTTGSLNPKTMRDREFINRFCAFYLLGYKNYRVDMDLFLGQVLKRMNEMSTEDLDQLDVVFQNSMINHWHIFDKYSFRRHTREDKQQEHRRSVINAALFDVWSVALSNYSPTQIERVRPDIEAAFYTLLDDEIFVDAIRISTSSSKKVRTRFEMVEKRLGINLNVNEIVSPTF